MATVFVEMYITDIDREILKVAVSSSAFALPRTTDGLKAMIEFETINLPIDVIQKDTVIYTKEQGILELENPRWASGYDNPPGQVSGSSSIVVSRSTDIVKVKEDNFNPLVTYFCKTRNQDALDSDPVWQLSREYVSGGVKVTEFAGDGKFIFSCADRFTAFGDIPFSSNKSIQLDGVNDFVDVLHNSIIDFDFRTEAASWNLWLKCPDTTGSVTYLEKQNGSTQGYRFYLASNRLTLELRGAGGTSDRIRVRSATGFGALLNNGLWHMLTATYDGSGLASGVSFYFDGAPLTGLDTQNDNLIGDSTHTDNLAIGARTGGGNNVGPCNIHAVSIWDADLSASDVALVYNSGVPINLQGQGSSPITQSLNYWNRTGDGPFDVYPNLVDVESSIVGTMTNMTPGDIETEVPR